MPFILTAVILPTPEPKAWLGFPAVCARLAYGVFVAILASLLLAGCNRRQASGPVKTETVAVPVRTIQVQPEALPLTIPVTGTLVSKVAVDVKAETTGRLVSFPKEEGDSVFAGEIVATVDQENYLIALRQAEAAVKVAEATLARAQVQAAHAANEFERAQNLLRSGGITQKDFQAAQMADRDAKAQVALAEAQLAQARSALDAAQKRLRDTQIRVPVSGTIHRKYVNVGAYVEPPTIILSLVDNGNLELESPIPSAYLGQVRRGQRVTFKVNSFPDQTFQGTLIDVNPAVDPLSRSVKARIRVDNSSGHLRAGMFAQGEILTGVRQRAIVVPSNAVYRSGAAGQQPYVFTIVNGKATRRNVELGRETDGRIEVLSGLKPGDVLVVEQRIELTDGVEVELRR